MDTWHPRIARAYEGALFAGWVDEVGRCLTDDVVYWAEVRRRDVVILDGGPSRWTNDRRAW
jgi:hypothetical protein